MKHKNLTPLKALNTLLILTSLILLACDDIKKDDDPEDQIVLTAPAEVRTVDFYEGLNVIWDNVLGATSYNLFWTDDGTEPNSGSNKKETDFCCSYSHTGLDFRKTYKYKVQAVAGKSTSPLSVTASGSPMVPSLDKPTNVNASVVSGNIRITWNPVNFEGVVYGIKRMIPATGLYYTTIEQNISATEFIDQNIEAGKGYRYKVFAIDNTYDRTSFDSDPAYAATRKTINETERNNQNISNTLSYRTHYFDAEGSTEGLDWFRIRGGYSGIYRIYSSGYYKYFEADCFLIDLNHGDGVEFNLISGDMSGIYGMTVSVYEWGKYTNGNDRELKPYTFTSSGSSFTYSKSNTGTVYGAYLNIFMWDNLINYGPYNYEVEIKINRK